MKVVEVEGKLDTNTSTDAEEYFKGLIARGSSKILVDLEKLNYISSAGLRVLLITAKELQAIDGELRLCSLSKDVHDVFRISGFIGIFSVHGGESEALEEF